MNIKRFAYCLCGPALLAGLLIISLLGGCRQALDPQLIAADSKMEEHPDSAMMLLNEYRLPAGSSAADSAYYGLLLTHARYKNFIDETDDSLISVSADYYLRHGDKERAARALFLQGMIRMNAKSLGEAAVSFRKGLDIAREGKHYMWEGQCARGLFLIYGELHDGSAQVRYAEQEYQAFCNSNDKNWKDYSKFDIAIALNNNGKYDQSLDMLIELTKDNEIKKDSLLICQIYQLYALSLFGLERYSECLQKYTEISTINPSALTLNDRQVIAICQHEISNSAFPQETPYDMDHKQVAEESTPTFTILACQGKYKEAYDYLLEYKCMQDSVLSVIFNNNVSESLDQYESIRTILSTQKEQQKRMTYILIFLLCFATCIWIIWRLREKILKEEAIRLKTEADLESLRADFISQLNYRTERTEEDKEYSKSEEKTVITDYKKIIRQKFIEFDRLCDSFYQGQYPRDKKEEFEAEVHRIIENLREREKLKNIEEYIDEKSDGLYSRFKKDYFDLTAENHRLFLYLILGFNARTIAVILEQGISAVYNKKSRLKSKIKDSDVPEKSQYLKFF